MSEIAAPTPGQSLINGFRHADHVAQRPITATLHAAREFGELVVLGSAALAAVYTGSVAHDAMEKIAGQALALAGVIPRPLQTSPPASAPLRFLYAVGCTGASRRDRYEGLVEGALVATTPWLAYGIVAASHMPDAWRSGAALISVGIAATAAIASAVVAHGRAAHAGTTVPRYRTLLL